MRKYIKKLQSKNEESRKQILVVSLVVTMATVGYVWIYGLTSHPVSQDQQANSGLKPLALLQDSIAGTYQNITASVGNFSMSKLQKPTAGKQIDLIVVDNPTNPVNQ